MAGDGISGEHTTPPIRPPNTTDLLQAPNALLRRIPAEAGAVLLSFLGAVLLYLSFTATTSDVSALSGEMYRDDTKQYEKFIAICVGDKTAMLQWNSGGTLMNSGGGSCPTGDKIESHRVAVVTRDSSTLTASGLALLVLSTLWQVWLIVRARMGKS